MKNLVNLKGVKTLNRKEQQLIFGGDGTCAFITGTSGEGEPVGRTHVSRSEALAGTSNGGRWCCDSCGSASWIEMNGDYMMLR